MLWTREDSIFEEWVDEETWEKKISELKKIHKLIVNILLSFKAKKRLIGYES